MATEDQSASLSLYQDPTCDLLPSILILKLTANSYGFNFGHPLCREVESVDCSPYSTGPAQTLLGPIPVGLMSIFYFFKYEIPWLVPVIIVSNQTTEKSYILLLYAELIS
jgi:hypothetical protein